MFVCLSRVQADAAVFAERINGLSLPHRAVVKALFLSGAEVIPTDAGVGVGDGYGDGGGAAGVDGDGEGHEVIIDSTASLLSRHESVTTGVVVRKTKDEFERLGVLL